MPQSRHRAKHHHTHQRPPATAGHHRVRATRRAAFVLAFIAAIFGFAVAYFTQGPDALWLFSGAIAGAVIGYLIGRSMDRSIGNN